MTNTHDTTPRQWSVTSDGCTIYKDNGLDAHKIIMILPSTSDGAPNPDGQFIIDCVNNHHTMRNALIVIQEIARNRIRCDDIAEHVTDGLKGVLER